MIVKLKQTVYILLALLALSTVAACNDAGGETAVTPLPPTPTSQPEPTAVTEPIPNRDFIVIATDAPNPPFTEFDEFGNVVGFNESIMSSLAAAGDFEYEFVITPYQGVLESLASGSREFDAVMPPVPMIAAPPGIAFTDAYLEVGQVLLVLADEGDIQSSDDLQPGIKVGVVHNSYGEVTALKELALAEDDVQAFDTTTQAVQALIDQNVRVVVLDNYSGEHFAATYPEQLKLVGGSGEAAWISGRSFGIAVAVDNLDLLNRLNQAIASMKEENAIERMTAMLIAEESDVPLDPGEPRTGTPAGEFIIGIVGQLTDMDPATPPDLISWEVKMNTMGGLYRFDAANQLLPLLAAGPPQISEDKLEYTVPLRQGLSFPDGREFTSADVVWSVNRARFGRGGYLMNNFLKDSDEDGYADPDAVQAVDPFTVKFTLQAPTAYFPSILATPPFFPISQDCYAEAEDLTSTCGGIGPYTIVSWEPDSIRLKANPDWPGDTPPAYENIKVRFYASAAEMRVSLEEFGSIDMAWTGLPYTDFANLRGIDANGDGQADYRSWTGSANFKSYIIFDQKQEPWNRRTIREAAALSLDREALAETVFADERIGLFSPTPDDVPGFVAALPPRDLGRAQLLLGTEGYTAANPLEVTLWYLNDGRYSPLEQAYAEAIKAQLEETGIFKVTLEGAPWETYRTQIDTCNYPAYLLGWPSPGQPVNYLDMTAWTDFFLENTTDTFCSNYESTRMTELVEQARGELDDAARLALYGQIQQLWATDLPTLDITQAPRHAISLSSVDNVGIDALGMLHYELLTKTGE
jgi:peptide/nickel transport system substrate-binding protein